MRSSSFILHHFTRPAEIKIIFRDRVSCEADCKCLPIGGPTLRPILTDNRKAYHEQDHQHGRSGYSHRYPGGWSVRNGDGQDTALFRSALAKLFLLVRSVLAPLS